MDSSRVEMPPLRVLPGAGPARKPRPARTPPRGNIVRLTPGDRRIALALYAAQSAAHSVVSTDLETRPRTLDEIVAMEQRCGWSHVFKTLKSQGLLDEQTLGHVIARWAQRTGTETAAMLDSRAALRAALAHAPTRPESR